MARRLTRSFTRNLEIAKNVNRLFMFYLALIMLKQLDCSFLISINFDSRLTADRDLGLVVYLFSI